MFLQPTLLFLPGRSHGQGSLVGYSPRGWKRVEHDLVTKQQYVYISGLELSSSSVIQQIVLFPYIIWTISVFALIAVKLPYCMNNLDIYLQKRCFVFYCIEA